MTWRVAWTYDGKFVDIVQEDGTSGMFFAWVQGIPYVHALISLRAAPANTSRKKDARRWSLIPTSSRTES